MATQEQHSGLGRREFLKGMAGLAGGAVALGAQARDAEAFSLLPVDPAPDAERIIPSYCEVCFWNCGIRAHVRGNRILYLEGHPDSPTGRGKLCGRGQAGAAFLRDADRLRYPLRRVGRRGEGRFERIGWPTAYALVAENFARIREKYGPEGLALIYHGSGARFIREMMVAYGCPNFAAPAYAQCKGARDVAYKLTFGEKFGSPEELDFDATRCMVFVGSHLGENAHNSQVQEYVRARARGADLIVLDPRFSTVAAQADVWLPIRPGSDLAVILAWLHLLIAEEAWDKDFVERYCQGFDQLAVHVRPFTPEWAAGECGRPAAELIEAYRRIKRAAPSVIVHPGRHVAWYGEADFARARGQAILTALLGAWWRPGGIYRGAAPKLRDFPTPAWPELPPHCDQAAGRFPFALEVTTNGIRESTRTGKPYPIKGWFVYASNILQSMPNVHETKEAIANLDFLVVSDVQPTEIVHWADVVLPEDNYLERYDDLKTGRTRTPYIALRQPVVKPEFDTRPAWRIARELGIALGVGDFFAYTDFEEYLQVRLEGSGTDLSYLKTHGVYHTPPTVAPYLAAGEPYHFHTPSGKVELYCPALAEKGFDPLPVYRPQPDPPAGYYRLLYGRSPLHTFARTQNNPILSDVVPANCVWIHPQAALRQGIRHDELVVMRNAHGDETCPLKARVTDRVPDGVLYTVHGFGSRADGLRRARCMGGSDTEMIDEYGVDPVSGCTGMRTSFVRLEAVRSNREVPACD